jgi:hypothetical protein
MLKKIYFFLVLVFSLAFISACSPNDEPSPVPTVATDLPESPTEPLVESIFGPGTFSLTLPDGWDVAGPDPITSDPDRPYESFSLGVDPTSSGGPGMSHVFIANADEWTPEELAQGQCSTCPEPVFESVTIDGKSGVRAEIGGGGVPIVITWYYVEHNGKLFAFAIHDPETLEPLREVIDSIRFE